MTKLVTFLSIILLLFVLTACDSGPDDEGTIEPTEENLTATPAPTLISPTNEVPTFGPTAYPPLPTPTPPGPEEGYPGFTPAPTIDPYPGGLATILHPMGLQCEDPIFPDLSSAVGSLEEAGIEVVAGEETGLEVCEACGCATSIHFRVQINAEDLDRALDLGWQR